MLLFIYHTSSSFIFLFIYHTKYKKSFFFFIYYNSDLFKILFIYNTCFLSVQIGIIRRGNYYKYINYYNYVDYNWGDTSNNYTHYISYITSTHVPYIGLSNTHPSLAMPPSLASYGGIFYYMLKLSTHKYASFNLQK